MKLRPNKNGNGKIGNYTISIGASEVKEANLLKKDGSSKELEKIIKEEEIIIKVKKS